MTRAEACALGRAVRKLNVASEFPKKFWARVSISEDASACWNWTGKISPGDKYPRLACRSVFKCISPAHRVAYALHYGFVPEGYQICHICNNKRCCNPAHLYAGTSADNYADMVEAGTAIGLPHKVVARSGIRCGKAKLSRQQVDEIRREYKHWTHGQREQLTRERYGITRETARRVYAGETYKHDT